MNVHIALRPQRIGKPLQVQRVRVGKNQERIFHGQKFTERTRLATPVPIGTKRIRPVGAIPELEQILLVGGTWLEQPSCMA